MSCRIVHGRPVAHRQESGLSRVPGGKRGGCRRLPAFGFTARRRYDALRWHDGLPAKPGWHPVFLPKNTSAYKTRRPQVRLVVLGDAPPPELKEMANHEGILVMGRVQDVKPYYHAARLSIAPLRAGGGTRLKILESMALGRPVVSTPVGCEGLDVVDREHIMIADAPAEFAERVLVLLTDRELADGLAKRARQLVQDKYRWPTIGEKLLAVYDELIF